MRRKNNKGISQLFGEIIETLYVTGKKIRLRKVRISDAQAEYTWRTDLELVSLDATTLLTTPFAHFLLDYGATLRFISNRHRFAVETLDGKHIGNCMYYNINDTSDEAEIGIMIGDRDYWEKGYGTDAVTALVNYVFLRTDIKRVHLKTLDWNLRAQQCFKKCGFKPYGRLNRDGYTFMLMELYRKQRIDQPKESNRFSTEVA